MKVVVDREKKVLPYNFKRPDRISKNQLRSLHFIHDRFARNFSSSVSAYLRTVVEVTLDDTAQISYAEFLSQASDPTCYASISLRPLDGSAAVEIEPELIFPMIDRLLGGAGKPMQNARAMTEIEQSIVQTILRLLVDNLKESWRPVYAIDFGMGSIETHPHLVQVVAPNEMVIHFKFQVRMRESLSKMHLALPMLVLEPIIHIFDQEFYSRKKIISDGTLLTQLRHTNVPVSIESGDTMFPMDSLLSLQVGDTLVLDQREEWPLHIKVAGKQKLQAHPKRESHKKTFEISGQNRQFKEERNGTNQS
jgi:flagellar motor switch protein FliM